jgi:hypothetical protein
LISATTHRLAHLRIARTRSVLVYLSKCRPIVLFGSHQKPTRLDNIRTHRSRAVPIKARFVAATDASMLLYNQ